MAPKKDKVPPQPSSKPAKSGGGRQKKKKVLYARAKLKNSEGQQRCDEGTEAIFPGDTTGANQSECMVNECTNTAFCGEYQEEEEEDNIPQESAPDVLEQEHRVVSPSNDDTVIMGQGETQSSEAETRADKKGEKKRGRKKKATTNEEEEEEEEANKSPEKKKKKNITLEKELLETPDDDIKRLPIGDMIRLVAYRQSLEKKEAKRAPPVVPPTQESNTNASFWDNQYHSQGFDAEEGEFGMEEDENHVEVKPDSPVNYQTNMKKTPRTRWSKHDTQLFYEGIQAFGIRPSMVHQLFPKRTPEQIKLKYKLEDRKNPWKIDDAVSTRCKDLTRYHTVIKKLEQKAAAAKKGEEAGEEAETTTDVPENEEEQTRSEKTDERAGDGVAGANESDGGDQFDENEGDDVDDFLINSYKSEM